MAQAKRLQALLDLSRALSSSLDLREVLREFATNATQLTGATAAELSTYDPARGELVMLVEYREGRDEITETGGQVYHLADYPTTRHVLDAQEPVQVRVENPDDDPAERALLERQGQKSLLMLPLVTRGETIGLMEIVDVHDRVWDDPRSAPRPLEPLPQLPHLEDPRADVVVVDRLLDPDGHRLEVSSGQPAVRVQALVHDAEVPRLGRELGVVQRRSSRRCSRASPSWPTWCNRR